MTSPSVSIVIPCFNTGHHLAEAIESALTQTMQDIEIIVVDDGSTDQTREVALGFDDPRLQYVYQDNAGLSAARNTGARVSRGRLLAFLDADDCFMPEKLDVQMDFLAKHRNIGLVAAHFLRVDGDGAPLSPPSLQPIPGGPISLEEVLIACPFATHSTLFSRYWFDRVGGYCEDLSAAEDWDFYCRLAIAGCNFYKLPLHICTYRYSATSMSLQGRHQTEAMLRVVERSFSNANLPERMKAVEEHALAETYAKGMARCYAARDFDIAKQYLREALEHLAAHGKVDALDIAGRLERLVSYCKIEDPAAWYQEVLPHLPTDAPGAFEVSQVIRIQLLEARIRASIQNKQLGDLLSASWQLLGRAPLRLASWILLSPPRRLAARGASSREALTSS